MSHTNDEDLDDFDDILDDFDAPPQPKASTSTSKPNPKSQPAADDKNFEDELSRNMAALLASFGGNGVAGVPGAGPADDPPDFPLGGEDDLAKLLEQIMGSAPSDLGDDEEDGGEGLEKLLASLGQPTPPGASTTAGTTSKKASKSAEPAADANGEPLSFEETMRQTMNRMKASEQESRTGADKVSVALCAEEMPSVCPCLNRESPRRARGRAYKVSAHAIGRFWSEAELINCHPSPTIPSPRSSHHSTSTLQTSTSPPSDSETSPAAQEIGRAHV